MSITLNCVLLVDDDKHCNLFHQRLFEKIEAAETVYSMTDGKKALDFLKLGEEKVDLILLDIDMPVMDGIAFLEEYEKLPETNKANVVIIMVTTAFTPKNKAKALSFASVKDFKTKYLDRAELEKILVQFFPEKNKE